MGSPTRSAVFHPAAEPILTNRRGAVNPPVRTSAIIQDLGDLELRFWAGLYVEGRQDLLFLQQVMNGIKLPGSGTRTQGPAPLGGCGDEPPGTSGSRPPGPGKGDDGAIDPGGPDALASTALRLKGHQQTPAVQGAEVARCIIAYHQCPGLVQLLRVES